MNPAKLARKWFSVVLLTSVVLLPGFSQTGSPPEILEIVFPHETIPADGSIHSGKVVFKDADGDAKWADFHVEAPDLQALTISDQTPEDGVVRLEVRAPADRQKQGQGIVLFKIAATAPQQVTIRVVLTDEAGNASDPNDPKATFSFAVRGPEPDLVVSLGELPESIQVGQTLETSYTIQNLGGSDSGPFRVGVYLSREAAITPEDLLIDSKEIGNLAPDASTTERLKVDLTQDLLARGGLEPGSLFLGVIADDLNRVEESDETNNIASSAIQVELPPKQPAFFKVVDLSIEPSSPVAGSTVTIKATIENTGEETGTKPVELYIDDALQDSRSLTLNPGQRKTVSFSHTFAFTEPSREVEITVKTPDHEQTLTVTVSQPPYTVCPSGCPFTKIQEAINAAKSGEIITVGPGTYNENLVITKSLTLKGIDSQLVILKSATAGKAAMRIASSATVTVEGFTITGARRPAGAEECGEAVGVSVEGRAKATFQNSRIIDNTPCTGIVVADFVQVSIQANFIVSGNRWGVVIFGRANITIQNSEILNNEYIGIQVTGSTGSETTIQNCKISGNGSGISAWSSTTITDNTISENKKGGIALWKNARATIQNNVIKDNGGCGIYAEHSYNITSCSGNTVSGNKEGNYCGAARGRCY